MKMKTRNSKLLTALFCAFMAACMWSATAGAWWNPDWTVRRKITIDTSDKGAGIGDPIGTTPVLIRLHDDMISWNSAKTDDLSDLRFVASDDKTLLTYHIENYDPLGQTAEIWVNIPDLKPGTSTMIWMYYGNPKAEGVNDPKKTYDKDTVLVYHFNEQG
ncbi:MAG TPA: DUF2341 domain-containing protein, partial [Chthoniobacteraceae bacterium]|nr:DUF2341 domain-containing protein [Chthoniobacteraceae bacterium]